MAKQRSIKRAHNFLDLTGQTFGRWTVLNYCEHEQHQSLWTCRCNCGTVKQVSGPNLRRGLSQSCGCFMRERSGQTHKTHGLTGTPEYRVWAGMIKRCNNPNDHYFACYGGRGIVVCERWRNFATFLADMGPRPSARHTIDRINNDGNYEPGNCRWATQQEQQQNRRNSRLITFNGETHCVTEWERRLGFTPDRIASRLRAGWSIQRAFTTPTR